MPKLLGRQRAWDDDELMNVGRRTMAQFRPEPMATFRPRLRLKGVKEWDPKFVLAVAFIPSIRVRPLPMPCVYYAILFIILLNIDGNPDNGDEVLNKQDKVTAAGQVPEFMATNRVKFFDYNLYELKKSVSSTLLDVALLTANASQLRVCIMAGPSSDFYYMMVTLIMTSILLQIFIGIALIAMSRININIAHHADQSSADLINTVVVLCVLFMVIVNVFIVAFGFGATSVAAGYGMPEPEPEPDDN